MVTLRRRNFLPALADLTLRIQGTSRWFISCSVVAIIPLMRIALDRSDQMRLLKYSALGTADAIMWGCLAVMAAGVSYVMVERPILQLKDRFKAAGAGSRNDRLASTAQKVLP